MPASGRDSAASGAPAPGAGPAAGPPSPVLLPGVDRAAFAVALALRLRHSGVPVGLTAIEDLSRALTVSPPDSLSRLYWAARISLVRHHWEIETFDAVFRAVFGGASAGLDPHSRRTPRPGPRGRDDDVLVSLPTSAPQQPGDGGLPWATLPPAVGDADGQDIALAVPQRLPSNLHGLADVPFEQLDPVQLGILGSWLAVAVATWPTRRSRRRRVDSRGPQIGLRATMQRSRRHGWEPIDLIRLRAVDKPRRVVMLCDISQSMQVQAPAYLHLMRALAVAVDAEVFAFATTLTRLTPALTLRSAQTAIDQATAKVTDRFGGTRIATNVRALLSSHHGNLTRGAVVIIASDGWDSDPPGELATAMARLHRRAHRVIWLNPRAAAPGFEPRVASMAAALPYCHKLLPTDTFRSLERVIVEISRAR